METIVMSGTERSDVKMQLIFDMEGKHMDEQDGLSESRGISIKAGHLFRDRYNVLEELGKGKYGIVWKVVDKSNQTTFAAKSIHTKRGQERQQVYNEIAIMNKLRHPQLLALIEAFGDPKQMIIVTEYISGGELFERVVADDFSLTEKDSIFFMKQICQGVSYMHHNKVVHLDLKPENIMCQSRASQRIKLIDFGLAQTLVTGIPVRVLHGTPEFVSPEIVSFEPVSTKSDIWSMGVISYVLLTGLSPFMGDTDAETFANIMNVDYDFDEDIFETISQEAKSFIAAVLLKKKESRMSAEACLDHPWLAQCSENMSKLTLPRDKLKKFIVRRKWQKTGNAVRAVGRMAILSSNSKENDPEFPQNCYKITENNGAQISPMKSGAEIRCQQGMLVTNEIQIQCDNDVPSNITPDKIEKIAAVSQPPLTESVDNVKAATDAIEK